jgi:hypothetical protein
VRYTPLGVERAPGLTRAAALRRLPPGWHPLATTAYDITNSVGGRIVDARATDGRLSLQLGGLTLGTAEWREAAIAIVQAELGSLRTCPRCGAMSPAGAAGAASRARPPTCPICGDGEAHAVEPRALPARVAVPLGPGRWSSEFPGSELRTA